MVSVERADEILDVIRRVTRWASVDPIDPGTRRVVTDGARVLYDPVKMLDVLLRACR
ncbi:hypothetical protein [Saccharomonospora marina]|uniref:hypothetical protein n=1 Tax=Saccharomonospora marina TaxID=632569 RepID=UPI0002E68C6D|nr:hypothetical protein [Saccharomonospora marina]